MLSMHPGWTDTKIAREVGVARTTLYDWPRYKNARALLKAGKNDRPAHEICQAVRRRRRLKPTPSPTLKNFILCAVTRSAVWLPTVSRHSPNGRGVSMSQTKNDPCQDSPVAWFVVLDRAERNTTLDVLRKPRAVCDRWACAVEFSKPQPNGERQR